MNPTQEQINFWITKAKSYNTNTLIEFSIQEYTNRPQNYLKHFIVDMKTQIDRWDFIMANLFVHPDIEKILLTWLKDEIDLPGEDLKQLKFPIIWGTYIIKTPYVPSNMMLGFYEPSEDYDDITDSRNIVIGKLDMKIIKKLDNMKAFW